MGIVLPTYKSINPFTLLTIGVFIGQRLFSVRKTS
jgi:hypothetical protein